MVPYVDALVAVTVMRVLLFVLRVCMMRECEGGVRGEGSEWMRGLGLGITNPVKTGEFWACVCSWVAVVWVV